MKNNAKVHYKIGKIVKGSPEPVVPVLSASAQLRAEISKLKPGEVLPITYNKGKKNTVTSAVYQAVMTLRQNKLISSSNQYPGSNRRVTFSLGQLRRKSFGIRSLQNSARKSCSNGF